MSTRSSLSTVFQTILNIKKRQRSPSESSGSGDNFERWRVQVNLLKDTYELGENAAKVLVGSKLRGKATEWYYSLVEHLTIRVDREDGC